MLSLDLGLDLGCLVHCTLTQALLSVCMLLVSVYCAGWRFVLGWACLVDAIRKGLSLSLSLSLSLPLSFPLSQSHSLTHSLSLSLKSPLHSEVAISL